MSGTTQAAPPGGVTIDRLALEIPGLDQAQATRLVHLVAQHLARAGLGDRDIAIPRLQVTLRAPDTSIEQIAWTIARAIRHAG
jgi:hypothetical protein